MNEILRTYPDEPAATLPALEAGGSEVPVRLFLP